MRTISHGILFAVATLALAGCAQHAHYRTVTVLPRDGVPTDQICEVEAWRADSEHCADHALQRRSYRAGAATAPMDYYLAFVEFDDHGWFWDRRQMDILLRLLHGEGRDKELLIVLYAHGWRHDASACDNNVICFARLLERLDFIERVVSRLEKRSPRKVVGVYVGWRGLSATVQPFELLSFWDRKKTAERVGRGGVTELLVRLNDFRRFKNEHREGDKTHLVITGHSFGGAVLFSALSNNLVERAIPAARDAATGGIKYSTATSFGDLVVLVNPAFEGNQFEALRAAATSRCYSAEQRPVLLIVTSKADLATRVAFPAGRFFGNLFERTREDDTQMGAISNTVGQYERYITHEVRLVRKSNLANRLNQGDESCSCPYLASTDEFARQFEADIGTEAAFIKNLVDERSRAEKKGDEHRPGTVHFISRDLAGDVIKYGDDIEMDRFNEFGRYATNYPYFVVSTNKDLIPGHNEIYGEDFTNFVRRFYIRHIAEKITFPADDCFREPPAICKPTDIEPCERAFRP